LLGVATLFVAVAAVWAASAVALYEVLWLYGIDLTYVCRLLINKELREDRRRFKELARRVLLEELRRVAEFLGVEVDDAPRLVVDMRFEEVPAGRFLAPAAVFVQHTRNLPGLRRTLRHEAIHYIHYNYLRPLVPWEAAEEFARAVEALLECGF